MNDLTTDLTNVVGGLAPKVDDGIIDTVERYESQVLQGRSVTDLMLPTLPTREERAALSRQASIIFETMKPISYSGASLQRGAQIIAALLGGYTQLAQLDAATKQKMLAAFTAKLSKLPLFAVAEACNEITRGTDLAKKYEVRPGYAPSDAQIYQIAETIASRYSVAKNRIDRILSINKIIPPPLPPEDREKVGKLLVDLSATLRAPSDTERAAAKAKREAASDAINRRWILREYEENGLQPHFDKDGNLITLTLLKMSGYRIIKRTGVSTLLPPNQKADGDDDEQEMRASEV